MKENNVQQITLEPCKHHKHNDDFICRGTSEFLCSCCLQPLQLDDDILCKCCSKHDGKVSNDVMRRVIQSFGSKEQKESIF